MTTATKSTIVTAEQLSACERIEDLNQGRAFYIVRSQTDELKEYKVEAIRKNNEWVIACTCPAGNPPVGEDGVLLYPIRECWHKRAAAAAAEEFKAALKVAAQAKIPAQKAIVAAPAKKERIEDSVPAWMLTAPVARHMKHAPREF